MRAAAQFSYCAEMQIYFFCVALKMLVPVVGFARVSRAAFCHNGLVVSSCTSRASECIPLGCQQREHLGAGAQLRLLGNYMDESACAL